MSFEGGAYSLWHGVPTTPRFPGNRGTPNRLRAGKRGQNYFLSTKNRSDLPIGKTYRLFKNTDVVSDQ